MLETIWFVLWGVLWAVYFMLDGFDFGVGTLMPFMAKDENERRIFYNVQGPFWDGNEVWLITAGGVTFAAFPGTYAVMFSALYSALMLVLFTLILRGVTFEFRGKVESEGWRSIWDWCHFIGSAAPALLFGVAFANIFSGIPIDANGVYQGTLLSLLNPYGLLGGLLFLVMFMYHGAIWLAVKTDGDLQQRSASMAGKLWLPLVVLAVAFLIFTAYATNLYANYLKYPVLWLLPVLAVAGLLLSRFSLKSPWKAWALSSLMVVACVLFGVAGLFPNLLPSNIDPAASMTAFNSSSSPLTLKIMLGVALVMVPIVIIYQAAVYKFFSHKITGEEHLEY